MKIFNALLSILLAYPLASAVDVRIATFNVKLGLGPSSDQGRINAENVLRRINADIVGLQEVTAGDLNNGYLNDLASNLGYGHIFIPETALDTGSRVIIISRFPFLPGSAASIVSPQGANDVTRAAAAIVVDVPGTLSDPVIVTAHLKCCFEEDDPFRRAVEMLRIRKHLEDNQFDGSDNVFVMGDFNLLGNNLTFSSLPDGLPSTFVLGNDITFDVNYFANPVDYFSGLGIINPGAFQQDGVTDRTFGNSSTILDYLLVSDSVAARNPVTEIYNSNLESNFTGLPKFGNALPATASADASDHFPVFGDFSLDDGLALSISTNQSILDEGGTPATITVTLDASATQATTITLQNNNPSEATLGQSSLVIPAGQTTASTTLAPRFDKISDGNQTVEILASNAGLQSDIALITVRDADPLLYLFESTDLPIIEDFSNFDGSQKPAAWEDSSLIWKGADDGSGVEFGARSYQDALGILNGDSAIFQTTLRNTTGQMIPALEINYDGQHWRRSTSGSPDRLVVTITKDGIVTQLPALTFNPSTLGQVGALQPPEVTALSTYLRDINLAPNEEIQLAFELVPGASVDAVSDDVFINEFHYDNIGDDVGEFIEVFVGQAFSQPLSDVSIVLYNGNNGLSYGTHSLDSFIVTQPDQNGGPRLFHKEIAGIQNGGPDGIALIVDGLVKEFISYEGAFTAVDGIAIGMPSTSIGLSQSNATTQPGQKSIARSGTGNFATDFTWTIQPGAHTPGAINVGQSFGANPQPQGLAVDNLQITPLADSDGDLLPDIEEDSLGTNPFQADTDLDGQDDFFEAILAGTNPLSGASFFQTDLTVDGSSASITFDTLPNRFYAVETSTDLRTWEPTPIFEGTGAPVIIDFSSSENLFIRVGISAP